MASVRLTGNGKFELTVRSKKLLGERRIYFTFDSALEAEEYGKTIQKFLDVGVIPDDLLAPKTKTAERLAKLLGDWIDTGKPAPSDVAVLERLIDEVGLLPLSDLSYRWCEQWVETMKLKQNLAPGTIRKRTGSLSRCIDWHLRQYPGSIAGNPLKLLPRGSSIYTVMDGKKAIALNLKAKVDIERDLRLLPESEQAIRRVMQGERRTDRERILAQATDPEFIMLFDLIVDTGLRLREGYRLRLRQLEMERRNLRVQSSKQWHGKVKYRDVPLKPVLHARLSTYLADRGLAPDDLIFPFWSGEEADLGKTTGRLTASFSRLFAYAKCSNMTELDLRHEATCRWFEMRRADGQWTFRESEIYKIMGWAPGSKMGMRYASFRAEDLADRMRES